MKRYIKQTAKLVVQSTAARLGPQSFKTNNTEQLWVLMYHRVLPKTDIRFAEEEPGMVVTPETFEAHINTLREKFEILHLTDWLERKNRNQTLPKRACAITFDDGWLDNYEYAYPTLQRYNTPASIFLVTEMIGTNRRFWPNRVSYLLSSHIEKLRKHKLASWFGPALRQSVSRDSIARCIAQLKQHSDFAIEEQLKQIEADLQIPSRNKPDLMNWDQVKELQNSKLIDFGCHTANHRRLLTHLSQQQLKHEIVDSKVQLEAKLGQSVNLFCYPNGDYTEEARVLVSKNFDAAVTTQRGINSAPLNNYELSRIGLHEDISAEKTQLLARLSGWRV